MFFKVFRNCTGLNESNDQSTRETKHLVDYQKPQMIYMWRQQSTDGKDEIEKGLKGHIRFHTDYKRCPSFQSTGFGRTTYFKV